MTLEELSYMGQAIAAVAVLVSIFAGERHPQVRRWATSTAGGWPLGLSYPVGLDGF